MYNRNLVFWSACLGMLIFGMVMISLGTINTFLTTKFALDQTQVGSLAALLPIGILFGSLVFGPIVDRFGYKILLALCTLLVLLGIEIIPFAHNLSAIQFAFFLIGFGGGVINGGTNALVSEISAEEKGSRLSFLGVFYGIGALGMPNIVGLMSKYFSTESVITVIGLFILIPVIFFLSIKFPEPKIKQGFPLKQSLRLFKNPILLLIGFVLFFESGMEGMVNNWSTTYLTKPVSQGAPGLSIDKALFALSLMMVSITITRLILGFVLKKIKDYYAVFASIVIIIIAALILFKGTTMFSAACGLFLMGVGFSAGFPVLYGYAGTLFSEFAGTAFSIILVIALFGNTLLNYLVGIISSNFGIKYYLVVVIGSALLMLVLFSTLVRRTAKTIKV